MNIITRIILIIGLSVPLSCMSNVGFFIKNSYHKFKTFSSRKLSRSSDCHKNEIPKKTSGSLITRTNPTFEVLSEDICEKHLKQTLSQIQQNNHVTLQDKAIVSLALADILLIDRKRVSKLLPDASLFNEQCSIASLIQYAIYNWCIKQEDVPENLLVNIIDIDWPNNRSSENEKKVYTLVHELAGCTTQQYLKDTLNKKDTQTCLAHILVQDTHEVRPISQDRTQSRTKKRSNS